MTTFTVTWVGSRTHSDDSLLDRHASQHPPGGVIVAFLSVLSDNEHVPSNPTPTISGDNYHSIGLLTKNLEANDRTRGQSGQIDQETNTRRSYTRLRYSVSLSASTTRARCQEIATSSS